MAPKEKGKPTLKTKKALEEERKQNHRKKMKGYWSKLNERKLKENALNICDSNDTSKEVAPGAARLGEMTSQVIDVSVQCRSDDVTTWPTPVTTGQISPGINLTSENSIRVKPGMSESDGDQVKEEDYPQ